MSHRRISIAVALITLAAVLLIGAAGMGSEQTREISPNQQHFPEVSPSKERRHLESDQTAAVPVPKDAGNQQYWYRNQVVVLAYHHIADDPSKPYAISPALFAQHMKYLHEHNLHPISLTQFLHFVDTGRLDVDNAVLITFDDGYESFYTQAYPVLKRYGFPSVNFVIAGRLRDSAERQSENMITPLSLVQLRELLASGIVDVGSHTYSLHGQTSRSEWGELGAENRPVYQEEVNRLETEQEYRDRLYVDFLMSRAALASLTGREVAAISFPLGVTNSIIVETARQAGYRYAFTSNPGVVKPGVAPLAIPRIGVGTPDMDVGRLEELFTSVKTIR